MKLLLDDIKRLPKLILGYILLATGIYFTVESTFGSSSWSVFHEGLGNLINMDFGLMTMVLGLIIMISTMFLLDAKIGIGTILNVLLVGFFYRILDGLVIDSFRLMDYLPSVENKLGLQILVFSLGMLLMTFGRSLYIAARLGPGPRDGLFVGLARVTRIDVKYVKPFIEAVVLTAGLLLGVEKSFGFGTIIATFLSGYMVQFFFKVLRFDPKTKQQPNIVNYFRNVKAH